jgi:hypothetical protein
MGFLSSLGFAGILNLLNLLLPVIQAGVRIAEAANPEPGSGAKKFGQVVDSVTQVALALPQVAAAVDATGTKITDAVHNGDVATLASGIGDVVNIAVKMANATGAFQKSGFVQAVTAQQDSGVGA